MTTSNNIVKSITTLLDEEISPLSETITPAASYAASTPSSTSGFFSNVTWQTWLIIFLILALLGINIFAYLAKGTQEITSVFEQIFAPILQFFGYTTLETTKQTIENTATGATAGVNVVANTGVDTINQVEQINQNQSSSLPSSQTSSPTGQLAVSSQPTTSIQNDLLREKEEANVEQYQQDSLEKALSNAAQTAGQVQPMEASSGKAGWCYIGDDLGVRTCSQVGINDTCLSGDIFPSQEICMNPNLRP
jgi:hypothetical protein